jgi:hypothetical protein
VLEKSPPARQVSPGKQLRAAMLKGRFADLIVKSQDKSLSVVVLFVSSIS